MCVLKKDDQTDNMDYPLGLIMNKLFNWRRNLKLVLFTLLILPEVVGAQQYFSVGNGDLVAGFRKTNPSGSYEMVSYLGNITNFLAIPAGNSISITNYAPFQLSNSFSSFGLLEWSVFAGDNGNNGAPNSYWAGYALDTVWYTLPRSGVGTQTTPPTRYGDQSGIQSEIASIGGGAYTVSSGEALNATNNTAYVVREPAGTYSQFMADPFYPSIGDFGGNLPSTVENTTPSTFTSAVVSDLYQSVTGGYNDPNTSTTTGNAYYVGYFTLNPNGTMTFTRASTGAAAPVAGFSGSPTNIFVTQSVVFTDASTGSITNWVWNFGDGNSVTNTSSANVNHAYATAGTYTVSLTVKGAGGSNTNTQPGYVVVYPKPVIGTTKFSSGSLILSGTNGVPGAQYRIKTSANFTNSLANWTPVWTNVFGSNGSFSYTNSTPTNSASFFIMVSP